MSTKNEVVKTDPNFRTWDKGDNGLWSSRPATIEEAKKHKLFHQWSRHELTYKEVLHKLNWSTP